MSDNEKLHEPAEVMAPAVDAELIDDTFASAPEVLAQLPGEILAARREEMRLSIEEVSTRLKLASRQIIALEANDFAQLPGRASLRGFVRSYAKLLEIDPEPLIAMLANESEPGMDAIIVRRPLPSPAFSGRRYSPPTRHRSAARRLSGLAIVLIVFVGTLAYMVFSNGGVQMPDMAFPSLRSLWPSSATADQVNLPEAVKPTEASLPAAPTPDMALQLKASQDSWVEVIAIDGERKIVSKLMKAGTTELIEITEPAVLIVGNATGVEAILRGQSLNLRAAARDNVAKLSLK